MYYDGSNWVNEKEDGVKWCEHITDDMKLKTGFLLRQDVYGSWSFCPLCGTPRPAEKRKLGMVLYESFEKRHISDWKNSAFQEFWNNSVKAAIEKICEEIDNVRFDHLFDDRSKKEKIKAHLKETLL